jgi:outer membrane protein assembly factor BamA
MCHCQRRSLLITVQFSLLLLSAAALRAQVNSRAEEIQKAREEKAKHLEPEEASEAEKRVGQFEDMKFLENLTQGLGGLRPKAGGLATGQGFGLGLGYANRNIAGGEVHFDTSIRASVAKAYKMDMELSAPSIADDHLFGSLLLQHRNFQRLEYYGPGPDSEKGGRSTYRLEDTSFDFRAGVKPVDYFSLGVTGGYLMVNVGPGTRPNVAITDQVFDPIRTPGIDNQTDFTRFGGFVQFDYTDHPSGPRSGGRYIADFKYYDDRGLDLFNFRQLNLEAQQYIPFFNEKRVFVMRARTVMSWSQQGQEVPFYLQPHLGGADDMRGFRNYRFYDDNHIVVNAEYRWEAFTGLDMALFFDAGKVTNKRSQINFHELETSAGFGFRFNAANATFLRLDVGFSHEGYQIWFKFGPAF